MKKSIKFNLLIIPNKLKVDERIVIDDTIPAEYIAPTNDIFSLNLFPLITISITRPFEIDDSGFKKRPPWNPNDNISLTKYNLPIFIRELKELNEDLKIKELYNYFNNRLEVNEELAEKLTKSFKIGNTAIQFKPVVIALPDDSRIEGIKIKFNSEDSTVLLSVNDTESMLYTLSHTNTEQIALMLYDRYIQQMKGKPNDWNNSRGQ